MWYFIISELFDELSTISRWLYTVSTWNKSELMSYGLHWLHSSIHNSNWGWGRVYLNNFIKIMFLEQHPNVDFVLEFGQFISVTWINLLRRLGFGQTHPPLLGHQPKYGCCFLNEPSLKFLGKSSTLCKLFSSPSKWPISTSMVLTCLYLK